MHYNTDDFSEGVAYDIAKELGADVKNYSPKTITITYGNTSYNIYLASNEANPDSIELSFGINYDNPLSEVGLLEHLLEEKLKGIKQLNSEFYYDGYTTHPLSVWAYQTLSIHNHESSVITTVELANQFRSIVSVWFQELKTAA